MFICPGVSNWVASWEDSDRILIASMLGRRRWKNPQLVSWLEKERESVLKLPTSSLGLENWKHNWSPGFRDQLPRRKLLFWKMGSVAFYSTGIPSYICPLISRNFSTQFWQPYLCAWACVSLTQFKIWPLSIFCLFQLWSFLCLSGAGVSHRTEGRLNWLTGSFQFLSSSPATTNRLPMNEWVYWRK